MNIYEKLSRANLKVGTRRLKWFYVTEKEIAFYDAFCPLREVRIKRTDNIEAMIIEAKNKLFGEK